MEQKDNTGALFRNEKKQSENQPDYTGTVVVNSKQMRIAAWMKTSQNGTRFLSLAFSEPKPQETSNARSQQMPPNPPVAKAPAIAPQGDPAGDLPF